jgi:hypothetical protein
MAARTLTGKVHVTKIRKGGWDEEIDRLIAQYDDGPPIIGGGLTVSGHSYWVILEYGSSPATSNPGPKPGDIVELAIPFNAPQTSKNHHTWYPIRPRRRELLVFTQDGRKRVARLVLHPGNTPRGFIRRIVNKVQQALYEELLRIDDDDTLPDRKDLVALVNKHLLYILDAVRQATPLGKPSKYIPMEDDIGHLRNAWGVELAR